MISLPKYSRVRFCWVNKDGKCSWLVLHCRKAIQRTNTSCCITMLTEKFLVLIASLKSITPLYLRSLCNHRVVGLFDVVGTPISPLPFVIAFVVLLAIPTALDIVSPTTWKSQRKESAFCIPILCGITQDQSFNGTALNELRSTRTSRGRGEQAFLLLH